MARPGKLKCLFCGSMFGADPRNARRQKYCSAVDCSKASKAASRRAWLAKPENQNYFRGPENVARVQAWRAEHPGYWRRPGTPSVAAVVAPIALQDLCPPQVLETAGESEAVLQPALQDLLRDQPAVVWRQLEIPACCLTEECYPREVVVVP